MKILTIIVSYNFEKWIDRCLGSLRDSLHPTDVVVIDNCSKDKTVDIIRKEWSGMRLMVNNTNLGFGKANNMGISIALKNDYDAVFLLNQDAWIDKYTLGTLCEASLKYKEYGILSPVHCDGSGKKLDFGFSSYAQIPDMDHLPTGDTPVECGFYNAAFWFIPTRVIKEVGGFSPLFYHYGEDKDYINRLDYYGYKMAYIPTIFGCHDRAERPVTEFDFFRAERVYLLSEYANINYSFAKGFAYGVLAGIKKAVKSIMNGKWRYARKFMGITAQLMGMSASILRVRKKCTSQGQNFV